MENFKTEGRNKPSFNRLSVESLTPAGQAKTSKLKESVEQEIDSVKTQIASSSGQSQELRDEEVAISSSKNTARKIRADEEEAKNAHSGLELERVFELLQ